MKLLSTTANIGDGTDEGREVPRYATAPGESVTDAAAKLGLRVMGRREPGADVVAVVNDARCAKVQS